MMLLSETTKGRSWWLRSIQLNFVSPPIRTYSNWFGLFETNVWIAGFSPVAFYCEHVIAFKFTCLWQ